MIAALFVMKDGPYFGLNGVDPYDQSREARSYCGPWPVVAHPPCARWGRYWFGGPSTKLRLNKGDDGGCFDRALWFVRTYGGVLEHPAHTSAFEYYNITKPMLGGWLRAGDGIGMVCHVEQGNYGHPARKATWLYAASKNLPQLNWDPAPKGRRLDEGFHSKSERDRARAAGQKPLKRLSAFELNATPFAFRDILIEIARGAR